MRFETDIIKKMALALENGFNLFNPSQPLVNKKSEVKIQNAMRFIFIPGLFFNVDEQKYEHNVIMRKRK